MDSQNTNYQVTQFKKLPVPAQERRRTDMVCIVINTVFVLLLFVIAIASLNTGNLRKMTYPTDGDGNTCGYDLPAYPYVYYTQPSSDPSKRLCVSECPRANQDTLNCAPTKTLSCYKNDNEKYKVQIYDSIGQETRLGLFCWPEDNQAKENLLNLAGFSNRYHFLSFYNCIWISLGLSFAFGLIYILLLQFFPLKVVPWTVLVGGIISIILSLLIIILGQYSIILRILMALFLITIGVLCIYTIFNQGKRKSLMICARMIEVSKQIVQFNYLILIWIPIFIFLLFCLLVLVAFEILAAWSIANLSFDPQYTFYEVSGAFSGFLTFLIFFQFYWGLSFLKQAFNFIISGYAVQWYCHAEDQREAVRLDISFAYLLRFHWGSVLGGSLLNWTFYYIDLFIDFFFNTEPDKQVKHQCDEFNQVIQESKSRTVTGFFNLLREETYAYINLVGLPFCNSSRYCEYLANDSGFFDQSQPINRVYRLGAHICLTSLVVFICLMIMEGTTGISSIYGIMFLTILSTFTVTFFISLHGDLSYGIQICIFAQEKLSEQITTPPSVVRDLYEQQASNKFDNINVKDLLIG